MKLEISHSLVSQLIMIEKTLAKLPKSADYASYYRKQAMDASIMEILALAATMELPLSADDAKDLLDSSSPHTKNPQHKLMQNCLSVMRYAKSIREHAFTSAVLQQENKLLADGFSDFWEEGKVRAPHETASHTQDGLRNRSPAPTYALWTDIRQLLSYPDEKIHPLLLATITAYHLIQSYPFLQFNLQTALLSVYTIIKPSAYWAAGVVSPLSGMWKTLQRTDFTFDPNPEHFSQFAEKFVSEYYQQLDTVYDALSHQSSIPAHIRSSLNDRQLKILTYFKQHKKLSRKKYSTIMNVAIATAFRDLSDLAAKGLIQTIGKGRGTTYTLAQLSQAEEIAPERIERTTPIILDTEY